VPVCYIYLPMAKLSKAERMKIIRERLTDPTLRPFQTEADKQAGRGKKARRKGESFQELIAADLRKIAKQFDSGDLDICSRPVTGHGEDILFSPYDWYRFGMPWIECKHYTRSVNAEKIFRQHAQKFAQKDQHSYYKGVPILVHRCDYQPILATMRQDDMIALAEELPGTWVRTEELVTVPWTSLLLLIAAKVATAERPADCLEPVEVPIEF
jgi:hypothetical protein